MEKEILNKFSIHNVTYTKWKNNNGKMENLSEDEYDSEKDRSRRMDDQWALNAERGFKSAMLLSTCYWIKKYNRIQPSSPGKRPTILYISNENTIHESIIRLFNMV